MTDQQSTLDSEAQDFEPTYGHGKVAESIRRAWMEGTVPTDSELFISWRMLEETPVTDLARTITGRTLLLSALSLVPPSTPEGRATRRRIAQQCSSEAARTLIAACDTAEEYLLPYYLWSSLIGSVPSEPSDEWSETVARLLFKGGHLTLQREVIRSAHGQDSPKMIQIDQRQRMMRGELIPPHWEPRRSLRETIRVVHVVYRSLPETRSGYAYRTQHIVEAQRRHPQLDPIVVSVFGDRDSAHRTNAGFYYVEAGPDSHFLLAPTKPTIFNRPETVIRRCARQLAKLVRHENVDVIHAHSDFHSALIALIAGESTGRPVVYESRGFWHETWLTLRRNREGSEWYQLADELEARCRSRAQAVVTLGEVMKDHIVSFGLPPESIFLAPNGVDRSERHHYRSRQSMDEDPFTVGYVGSVSRYEGLDLLVRAIAILCQDHFPSRAIIVGDGADLPRLRTLVDTLEINDSVELTGRLGPQAATRRLSELDAYVIPRLPLTVCELVTPLKPIEAMASGIPLVMSDLPALKELSEQGQFASHFEAGSVSDLVQTLRDLRDNWEGTTARAEAARSTVSLARTWDAAVNGHLEAYRHVGAIYDGAH